ncbi:chemotaxis protein CheD [Hydrocarboniclastica marina]|uniref:Probable chemoreceptor glutamine deamidase CheD n=1 Tax=Hydrocarboniclastica marina TaxID=2259620 RepID=A0A4P7XGH8_9ALTE|nr:chemotaxis protein CheD [Hydrocarboniclastica marina]MAL99361.1 chemotaxis protein CheD [Alteromonadaceae bacterium]QCF26101.1 chemotaxis protein CheD [Hydrocarboniclastica marina]|tara:strand:+ start:3858 stop:4373 length:516 start_codon:yes stop_codon:yes gene_type:complete
MIHRLGSAIDIFLHPGEHDFVDEHFNLRTTLGSCVSIVLWHPTRHLGGMCHYLLPEGKRSKDEPLNGKYADQAFELLLGQVRKHGTQLDQYQVKLFGGGNMFPGCMASAPGVASRNIEAARRIVARHRLNVTAESLGGAGHRNLVFEVASGDVWVQHINIENERVAGNMQA